MNNNLAQLIDEAFKLELNVAALYMSFHHTFPEDSSFWWNLALEEKNHAALLKTGMQHFMQHGLFPYQIVNTTVEALVQANNELERLLEKQKETPLSRESAFNLAIKLEESAGEIHFQYAMEKEPDSLAMKLFASLNKDDKDHVRRIREYMRDKGIGQIDDGYRKAT